MNEEVIDELFSLCNRIDSIEIVGDLFIPNSKPLILHETAVALAKSVYKAAVKYIAQHVDQDPSRLSRLGAMIGSYDSRVWTYRKKPGIALALADELHLCHLGLTANPKSAGAFENLRWWLRGCQDEDLVANEREFCSKLTSRRERNALLWRHRVWCSRNFHSEQKDLEWTRSWTADHPADSSAFYFMETLMSKEKDNLIKALSENTRSLFSLPGHESIWHHRRFLIQNLQKEFPIPDWKVAVSPREQFEFPELAGDRALTLAYQDICNAFCVDINMILVKTDADKHQADLNLELEDLVVAVARSDHYPVEFANQRLCAEKHFRWLRCRLLAMLKS